MSNRPFQPTPRHILGANRVQARKAAIAAIVNHYTRKPAEVSEAAPATGDELSVEEAELLKNVLGIDPRTGATRNRYLATRLGRAHRLALALRDRGLVNVIEDNTIARVQATSLGILAVQRVLEQGRAA